MATLSLDKSVIRFQENEERINKFSNGSAVESYTTSNGVPVPSIQKFLAAKDEEINVGADSILSQSQAAADAAAAGAASVNDTNLVHKTGNETIAGVKTFTSSQVINVTDNTNAALRITQTGTGNALLVEDATNPDATPFVVNAEGNVGIGVPAPPQLLAVGNSVDQFGAGISGVVTTVYFGSPITGFGGMKRINYDRATGNMNFIGGSVASPSTQMTLDNNGNVGIGTSSPNASAILDAQSTTKGVRMPNMTTTQKNAIDSPAAGLMVFDTTLAKLCVYTGAAWQTINSI